MRSASGSHAITSSAPDERAARIARSIDSRTSGLGARNGTAGNVPSGCASSGTDSTRKPAAASTAPTVFPPVPCSGVNTTRAPRECGASDCATFRST